jgi:two-component system response regulator MprA
VKIGRELTPQSNGGRRLSPVARRLYFLPRMHALVDTATILVVEDSPELVTLLKRVLAEQGWQVASAGDGDAGLAGALERKPDMMIVDVGLPRRNGFEVIRELRRRGVWVPVLMLTARGEVADRVTGLDAGADDYLAKPFDTDELVARVRALLRRAALRAESARLVVGEVRLDPLTREVFRGGRRLVLTQREFALLEYFMRNVGRTVNRGAIAQQVWHQPPDDVEATNIIDVYVAYLRKKLDGEGERPMLHTVRGRGYVLRLPAE